MVFLAFVIGLSFAWLTQTFWVWLRPRAVTRRRGKVILYGAAALAFGVSSYVFVQAIFQGYAAHPTRWEFLALLFATTPRPFGVVIGFIVGACLVWFWTNIQGILLQVAGRGRRRAAGRNAGRAQLPYPWLAGIVGIAAVTLVSIVAILAFFPEVVTRLEQVKIGGVEARFATSATQTVHVNSQSNTATYRTNAILNGFIA